jgi:hypothetical protein
MPKNYSENSNTLVIEADQFSFETLTQENGNAIVIRFQLQNPEVRAGDVLLILSGSDIHFHGLIGRVEEGSAIASDSRSLLPSGSVH